ncbi:MFS transporter [Bacillus sp. TH22]|uniref:MFS transporter n=1 Tax=unclassified Bacillus (in: firmicutes) TaxID=185979 RepID=UPI00191470DE|nr:MULTISPECIES: MFS transporter [unclassified Bacillus (in: firmicutes)]MBK5358369.1 MFS transporter [Bacillus sp. TH44]MBK5346292.1 MFS transporter [Bacillus sp. TH45]MBK5366822.1 MFS transporter [Bacillus sp. TH50]MBK5448084.1 MFS transporter [Bacillus sp. TH22]MBK5453072.1 MFS transporter [Bacillus sp. TH23]
MPKRSLTYYLGSKICITLADIVYIMIITTHIYITTRSATITALFPLLQVITNLIANTSAPLIMNRFPSYSLLYTLQWIKTALLILLMILFPILSTNISALLTFVIFISLCSGWSAPLLYAVIPRLTPQEKLVKVNSAFSFSTQIIQAAAYSFTSIIVLLIGVTSTLMINNILMIFGCITLHLSLQSIQAERVAEPTSSKTTALLEGWKLLFQHPSLRIVTIMDLIETFAGTIWIGAITMAYVTTVLHKGEDWWGYINTSYYVGTLIGGILAWKMSTYIQKNLIRSMAIGSLMFSILTFLYGMTSSGFIALFLCVLMGPCYQIRDISQTTVLQSSVTPSLLSKMYTAHGALLSTASGLSMLSVGIITDMFGVRTIYIIAAFLILCSACLSFNLLKYQKTEQKDISL